MIKHNMCGPFTPDLPTLVVHYIQERDLLRVFSSLPPAGMQSDCGHYVTDEMDSKQCMDWQREHLPGQPMGVFYVEQWLPETTKESSAVTPSPAT